MSKKFWSELWEGGANHRFDQTQPNRLLKNYFESSIEIPKRWYLPLCGRSVDIDYLLSRGREVEINDFCRPPIMEVFERLKLSMHSARIGDFERIKSPNLTAYVGDCFNLNREILNGEFSVYDRAGMVIFDHGERIKFVDHISDLQERGSLYLLVGFDYPENKLEPDSSFPHPLGVQQVEELFSSKYEISIREQIQIESFFQHILFVMKKR